MSLKTNRETLQVSAQREGGCDHLVVSSQGMGGQQRPAMDCVWGVVDQNGSVLYLEDLDAVSHHRGHAELTQLQRKQRTPICQL